MFLKISNDSNSWHLKSYQCLSGHKKKWAGFSRWSNIKPILHVTTCWNIKYMFYILYVCANLSGRNLWGCKFSTRGQVKFRRFSKPPGVPKQGWIRTKKKQVLTLLFELLQDSFFEVKTGTSRVPNINDVEKL